MAIKTETIECTTYTGVDIIKAREAKDMSQGNLAKRCDWSTSKQHNREMLGKFIVIPEGFKHITEADFDIMQKMLK